MKNATNILLTLNLLVLGYGVFELREVRKSQAVMEQAASARLEAAAQSEATRRDIAAVRADAKTRLEKMKAKRGNGRRDAQYNNAPALAGEGRRAGSR